MSEFDMTEQLLKIEFQRKERLEKDEKDTVERTSEVSGFEKVLEYSKWAPKKHKNNS
jgi:hypothetical protein